MENPDLAGRSDIGRRRAANEDQLLIAELGRSMRVRDGSGAEAGPDPSPCAYLLLVADGMGGAPAGAEASALVSQTLARYVLDVMSWHSQVEGREAEIENELRAAVTQCQARIEAEVARRPDLAGMGTTLTAAYVDGASAFVV